MNKNEISEMGEQIVKQKRPKKSEQMSVHTDPGDNSRYIGVSMALFKMPKVDLQNVEAVDARLEEYFQLHYQNDMKPTVVGMAMALGISRQQLWSIKTGQPYNGGGTVFEVPTPVANSIKRAYNFMENLWENYMQNGKINPVSGIFLGKNNFGYQDKTEYVVTPNVNQDNDYSTEDVRKRYLTDGNDSDS